MAQKVSKSALDRLMNEAGLSAENKKKMHEANGTEGGESAATPTSPRGHGAARPHEATIDEL